MPEFQGSTGSRGSICVKIPNFASIVRTVAEIWRFFDCSKTAAVRHLGFVMLVFGQSTKGICCSLSLCKIWYRAGSSMRLVRGASGPGPHGARTARNYKNLQSKTTLGSEISRDKICKYTYEGPAVAFMPQGPQGP